MNDIDANRIVAHVFDKAGWSLQERPTVAEDENGEKVLSDGRFWEPLADNTAGLRVQCLEWIEAAKEN